MLAEQLRLDRPSVRNAPRPGLHPTRTAEVLVGDQVVGGVGEIDPAVLARHNIGERVAYLEVDLDSLLALPHGERPYRPFSTFPSSDIDVAFEVDDSVSAIALQACIRDAAGPLLWSVELFDVFRGGSVPAGRRSLAYSLRLQAPDRTLTDADVAEVRTQVIAAAERDLGATLRG